MSEDTLIDLVASINQQWSVLSVRPQPTDYLTALDRIASDSQPAEKPTQQVVLSLGSNIGNFAPDEAINFYQNLSSRLRPGDLVLTGFDLQKHPAII